MADIFDSNFNLDENVSETALVHEGEYHAGIIGSVLNKEKYFIKFTCCLNGNDGIFMSNGRTPVDGVHVDKTIWLPKPNDFEAMTKSGRETKASWKLNALKQAMKDMQFSYSSIQDIFNAVQNGEFNGQQVKVIISHNEYQGKITEQIDKMYLPVEVA